MENLLFLGVPIVKHSRVHVVNSRSCNYVFNKLECENNQSIEIFLKSYDSF